ncbi:MAG: MlaD family protein [Desulfobulbaceae bacterium]|nr:MlaD family protein [Desulfobulbaceae bacterium]
MTDKRTKFWVGLFVAGGLAIAVAAVIWLGMSRFFEKGSNYAVYFDESVQGLAIDSPVKYRGVAIGRVERIGVAADSKLIEVIVKIESELKPENNLIAQLKAVGITGSMFIELDRKKDAARISSPELHFPTEYPVLASRPSEISELFRGIDQVIQKMNDLDIAGISQRLNATLDHIDQAVVQTDVVGIGNKAHATLDTLKQSITDLDLKGISVELKKSLTSLNADLDPTRWDQVMSGLQGTIVTLDRSVNKADKLLDEMASLTDTTDSGIKTVSRHLQTAGKDIEQSTSQLRQLLEQLNDQPSRLLFSAPPPRRLSGE